MLIDLIIVCRLTHLGNNSCYYNDYLYHSHQHVIIIIIIIVLIVIFMIIIIITTCTARKGIYANVLSPEERGSFRVWHDDFQMADCNHLILLAQNRSHAWQWSTHLIKMSCICNGEAHTFALTKCCEWNWGFILLFQSFSILCKFHQWCLRCACICDENNQSIANSKSKESNSRSKWKNKNNT